MAEKSSTSADLVAQAKALIRRTKALATVDPVRDWKVRENRRDLSIKSIRVLSFRWL